MATTDWIAVFGNILDSYAKELRKGDSHGVMELLRNELYYTMELRG